MDIDAEFYQRRKIVVMDSMQRAPAERATRLALWPTWVSRMWNLVALRRVESAETRPTRPLAGNPPAVQLPSAEEAVVLAESDPAVHAADPDIQLSVP
jgi:hypothetical protein